MKITLRNPERKEWTSGYGVINRELTSVCDSENDLEADIHFFVSPPYSFEKMDTTKYNVGLTMGERGNPTTYAFPFIQKCNAMDLIITTSPWQKQVMKVHGVRTPIEIVPLGIDYKKWFCPVRGGKNVNALILDRGRDTANANIVLQQHLPAVHYMDCRTPKPTSEKNKEVIKKGRYTDKQVKDAYKEADVFFKWGREGWGFPILEAMAAGCLIITNCVHLGYLVDGKNALFFRSVPEMRKVLNQSVNRPLTQMKQAGQDTAKGLTWNKARKGVLAAIRKHAKRK